MGNEQDAGVAEAIMVFLFFAVCAAGAIAFFMAEVINIPKVKSDYELCKERGGVWVRPYKSSPMCFSKDAFK